MVLRWRDLRGRTLLVRFLERRGRGSQKALAETLGTTDQVVYSWTIGLRRPGRDYRETLEIATGIPRASWMTSREQREERARIQRAEEARAKRCSPPGEVAN